MGSNPIPPTSLRSKRSEERTLPRRSLLNEAGPIILLSFCFELRPGRPYKNSNFNPNIFSTVTFHLFKRNIIKMEDFETFFKKQQGKLFSYLMRMTGDYHLSMDIMQESFTRYLEKYAKDTRNTSLLYSIAHNYFLDYKRKDKRTYSLEQDQEDCSSNQEDNLQIKQEYYQVLEAMKKLENDEREILALVLSEDLSYKDIASIVGTNEGNVKVKIHRARVKLREILKAGE